MQAIAIYWEEYSTSKKDKKDNKKSLYLLVDKIYGRHELEYVGTDLSHLCKIEAQLILNNCKPKIYRGSLSDSLLKNKNISPQEQDEAVRMAKSLLINILEYPLGSHCIRSVGGNTVIVNYNLRGALSFFFNNSEYFWRDDLRYDIARAMSRKLNEKIVYEGTFYGFSIGSIYCGVDTNICDSTKIPMVIRVDKNSYMITPDKEEKIQKDLGVKILSDDYSHLILLGGIDMDNIDTAIQGVKLLAKKISPYLSKPLYPSYSHNVQTCLRKRMD